MMRYKPPKEEVSLQRHALPGVVPLALALSGGLQGLANVGHLHGVTGRPRASLEKAARLLAAKGRPQYCEQSVSLPHDFASRRQHTAVNNWLARHDLPADFKKLRR